MKQQFIQADLSKVEVMVQRLAKRFHPDKIILFGSYARGQITNDSDVDLLVVMPVEGSKRKAAAEMDLALADRDLPLDLIVVTPEEYDRYQDTVGSVIYPAAQEGRVMYEQKKTFSA